MTSSTSRLRDLRFIVGALTLLVVAIGVGRFAYTPILPLMRSSAGLSQGLAGALASANLLGYLLGALVSTAPWLRARRLNALRASIAVVVVTTATMAFASPLLWAASRFLTGLASGCVFVLASSLVLDRAAAEGKPRWVSLFYGGVGLGITLTGVLVPPLAHAGGWRGTWLGLAAASGLACALTLPWVAEPATAPPGAVENAGARRPVRGLFWWLFVSYGAEGLGYIIPATFMVAMIAATPALARYAALSWVVVGLVAVPSTTLWAAAAARFGRSQTLVAALLVQAFGAYAPVAFKNEAGVALAAVLLGATFVAITAQGAALGRELDPERSHVAIGRLTTIFGVGQVVGPLAATALTIRTGSYDAALILAAVILCISAALMLAGLLRASLQKRV